MKITKIEKKQGTRFTVYADEEYLYIFDIEILQKFGIKEGVEITEADFEAMKEQAQYRTARERAYYLISYRDHSEKELFDKLCKSVDEHIAAATVAKMVELNLVNDEEYARKLAKYLMKTGKKGQRRVAFEMKRKGLSTEVIQEAMESVDVDPIDQIYEMIGKRYYKFLGGDYNEMRKVVSAFARKGFDYADIKTAISLYKENEQIEENEEYDQWQYE